MSPWAKRLIDEKTKARAGFHRPFSRLATRLSAAPLPVCRWQGDRDCRLNGVQLLHFGDEMAFIGGNELFVGKHAIGVCICRSENLLDIFK